MMVSTECRVPRPGHHCKFHATIVADVPLSGRQTLANFGPILVDETQFGSEGACGATLDVEVSLNDETGLIETAVNIR